MASTDRMENPSLAVAMQLARINWNKQLDSQEPQLAKAKVKSSLATEGGILWAISEKIQTGVEDMEFSGVDFEERACGNWRGQLKKKCNFQALGLFKKEKNATWNFHTTMGLALLDART